MKNLQFSISTLLICSMCVSISYQLTGQFWQLTDLHWDLNYTQIGGNPRNMCWIQPLNNSLISQQQSQENIGRFGNYNCDAPWELVISVLQFMKQRQPNPDFIIWTGDDDSHVNDYFFSPSKVIEIMRTMSTVINVTFPGIPVLPTFGNHDAFPKSSFSPDMASQWYMEIANLWRDWLGEDGYITFQKGGYYQKSHPTLSNVTVIGLNTPVYYLKNKMVQAKTNANPLDQLSWLDNTLTKLAANQQKAYIVAHIPPGVFGRKVSSQGFRWFQEGYNKRYVATIIKHANTIIGQFYGHDHTDSFKLYYDRQGNPVNMHFVAPAVTPWNTSLPGIGPNNPGVRLFTYDLQTGNIINYEQYYLNLTKANQENRAELELEYDFLRNYDLPDMSYASVNRLAQTFATTDRTYFDRYYLYNSVSYTSPDHCNADCQRNQYCAITCVEYESFVQCNNISRTDNGVPNNTDDLHRRLSVARSFHHQQLRL